MPKHLRQPPAALLLLASLAAAQTPIQPPSATIRIDATRVENHVSPGMYAAFVEMMAEDVKRGLTAEMLLDRSFEDPADYLHLPAHWQLEPDERNDNVAALRFDQTTEAAYPATDVATNTPNHSLRITLAPGNITDDRRGLSQGRLSIRAGQPYSGFWLKLPADKPYNGHISVALEEDNSGGQTYAQTTLQPTSSNDWQRYPFSLTPTQTDRFAKLTLLFDGHGTLLLDQLSLEPANALTQVRPDSEALIAKLHPSFIRWPGGNVAQDYHWQWGIGPRDLRPVWINKSWSNAPEPDDLGTDEYLALCDRLHIQPSITVNVDGDGATPEEAAAWVEYVNGPATSHYGAMRAANGHPAPYHVTQWELGNEIFGNWVRGHVTAQQYAQAAVRYAHAMRAVDPTLQLIAVGEGIFPQSDAWNTDVLKIAGPEIQYLAIHDYTSIAQSAQAPNPFAAMMGRPAAFEANYRHIAELIHQLAPTRDIHLIVNEWNLFYDAQTIQSMTGAVYAARMMNGFERDGDIVHANSISDLLNGWVGGILQASRDRIFATPQYYALQMYSQHLGTDRLHLEITSPNLTSPTLAEPATTTPAVDALATRTPTTLYLKLSNADPTRPIATSVQLTGFPHPPTAQLTLLQARTSGQRNSFTQPQATTPQTKTIPCAATCRIQLPPNSVAILTLRR